MIKILLCDDNIDIIKTVRNFIKEYDKKHEFKIVEFSSGDNVIFEYEDKIDEIDLIIMDIEMPGRNGIETMIKMREYGYKGELLYLSSIKDYVFESFDTRPLNYMLKDNLTQNEINDNLDKAIKLISNNKKEMIVLGPISNQIKVNLNHIVFIESSNRKIILNMIEDDFIEVYMRLEDIISMITNEMFIRIHKSYVVNFEYVKSIKRNELTLTNGQVLIIGRTYLNDVKDKFSEILSNNFIMGN